MGKSDTETLIIQSSAAQFLWNVLEKFIPSYHLRAAIIGIVSEGDMTRDGASDALARVEAFGFTLITSTNLL